MNERFIIVGCGITAISAVKAIREVNENAEIHMFGDEKFYPYNRIKLSKSLFDKLEEGSILLQKKDWYEVNRVNLNLNTKVKSIETSGQEVVLSDGTHEKYDKLLIATGAGNAVPPIDGIKSQGVYTLRGLEDARNIHENLENKNVVVNIGAGSQGLETAWILHQHGKKVIVIQRNKRLMPRELDEKASLILKNVVEKFNIGVLTNTQLERITHEGSIKCTTKSGDKIECDMLIYSAGISPNIEVLKGTSVNVNHGIVVDKKMRTNIENIYAAGDVAEYNGKITGLWNIAIVQGKTAGYNMAGKEAVYEHIVPVTTLNAFGISLFSMGKVDEDSNVYTIKDEDDKS
ncbi:MAG TPA: FAD-dependent oxidoreductase, partial [Clostridia bacterium]